MTLLPFRLASGSIPGRHHIKALRNNQDAYATIQTDGMLIAVVADGCGSSVNSEIGAHMLSRYLVNTAKALLTENIQHPMFDLQATVGQQLFFEALRQRVLGFMHLLVNSIGTPRDDLIRDYFLFTILGVVMTESVTVVFGLGDGVYQLNENIVIVDQNNTPSYLGYAITSHPVPIASLSFEVREVIPTEQVNYLVVGTDGADMLIRELHKPLRDGTLQGGLDQFRESRYVRMKSAVEKRLRVIGHLNGLAEDDTTLIVVQRHKEEACPAN